ncbi:MAG: DUF2948 family protein [Candidatus Puniceispirillaceae bacterium]
MTSSSHDTDAKAIRLVVRSADDVTMLSAFLQDGLIAGQDIHYDKVKKEVIMVIDRYRWEADAERRERVLMGLRIGQVSGMQHKKLEPGKTGPGFYNLLNLAYVKEDDGRHMLQFTFSAGGALRLTIEDLVMSAGDIAPPRPAIATPHHDDVTDDNSGDVSSK